MDKELQADAADNKRNLESEHGNHSSPRPRKPGRRQKKVEPSPKPIELLLKTKKHFLPGFSKIINRMPDPRREEQCVYSQSHLIWNGILLFMMHLGSRRQMRFERLSDTFEANLARLSGQADIDSVADPDTLAYYAEKLNPEKLEEVLAGMTRSLIRMKAFDSFRLYGYFTIAIDGSQICTFKHEPWPGAPHRKLSNGSIQYFSYVLDAKLVTPCGMALTLASEMLTNEGNSLFDKQDCELKAFPRLVEKLQSFFPRTPMCLLLDGLYANQNAIRLIEGKKWKYIITFKEGSMPERFKETISLARIQENNRLEVNNKTGMQSFQWVDQLPIEEFSPNVLFCRDESEKEEATNFVWLTNFNINKSNVTNIANKGGRLRWKIENEGFNVQKNDGYEMKHVYSEDQNGFRTFYIILQIAHYITQLILHGSLIRSLAKSFGSAKNFARRFAESMRNHFVPVDLPMPGQIRFLPP